MKLLQVVGSFALVGCLGFTSPVFNRNYVYTTRSANKRFTLLCLPKNCKNNTDGCLKIVDTYHNTIHRQFDVKRISGCVFIVSNDGNSVFEIPSYQGFPLFSYDFRHDNRFDSEFDYIKIYHKNQLQDSIKIPRIVLTKENEKLILTKAKIDAAKVIRIKGDSVAVITCRGIIFWNSNHAQTYVNRPYSSTCLKTYHRLAIKGGKKCTYDLFEDYKNCPPTQPVNKLRRFFSR